MHCIDREGCAAAALFALRMGCCDSKPQVPEQNNGQGIYSTGKPIPETEGIYAWIRPSEVEQIKALREALSPSEQAELEAAPEDIRHDLMLCRFLRGNEGLLVKAVEALRALLKFRRENRDTIEKARALFPSNLEHYTPEVGLHWQEMADKFIQLQLPGYRGTNTGMPVSLLVSRFFDLEAFASASEETMKEWFLSCVEQRSYTLHKQSMREKRMVRVTEMRDLLGFSWSQFLLKPLYMKKVMSVFKCGEFYPELMDTCFLCNLRPGGKEAVMLKTCVRIFPEKVRHKFLWAEASDWETVLCSQRGVSLSALSDWILHQRHVDDRKLGKPENTLTSTRWQALDTIAVAGGGTCEWHVRCESITGKTTVRVCVWFLKSSKGQQPQACKCCGWEELHLTSVATSYARGSYQVPDDGTVLVEALLQGSRPAKVSITFGPADRLDGSTLSDVPTLVPFKAQTESSLTYTVFLLLLALMLAFYFWPLCRDEVL